MEQLSSLAGIPVYKKGRAEDARHVYLRIAKNINFIYCLTFNQFFHNMHHRNRENILHSIPPATRALLLMGN
jgi:hypothetical protein